MPFFDKIQVDPHLNYIRNTLSGFKKKKKRYEIIKRGPRSLVLNPSTLHGQT